jgi:hypothetical protein
MITETYNGVNFKITKEAVDDMDAFYGVDAIAEIKRGIDLAIKGIDITVTIKDSIATMSLTRIYLKETSNAAMG